MKKIIFAIAFALASLPAFAQGALFHDIVLGNNGRPAPSPTYRVCTTPGSPCTGFVSIYSDKALTVPIVNTGTATGDTLGNINLYAAPGDYCVQVSGTGITTYNIGGSSTSCDVRLSGLVSIPASIAQGGTNATTAAAAFNNLNPMTTLGDTLYESAANIASRLAGNTSLTQAVLCQTGTGTISAAPTWCPTTGTGGTVVEATGPTISGPTLSGNSTINNVSNYGGAATAGMGVDPIYAVNATQTGKTAAVGPITLLATGSAPGVGQYEVIVYIDSTVTCATPGPAVVGLTLTWTDEAGTKTAQTVPVFVNGGATPALTLPIGTTTGFAWGDATFWATATTNIQYSTTYTACTSGTGTYSLRVILRKVQ